MSSSAPAPTRRKHAEEEDFLILILLYAVQALAILPALLGVILAVGATYASGERKEDWLSGSSVLTTAELALSLTWVSSALFASLTFADEYTRLH